VDWLLTIIGNPSPRTQGPSMIKPRIGDIGRQVVCRMSEVGQEKRGVLLNMEPANDPAQAKVLYDDEWEATWVSCDVLDWLNRFDRLGERPPDQSNDGDKG